MMLLASQDFRRSYFGQGWTYGLTELFAASNTTVVGRPLTTSVCPYRAPNGRGARAHV